MTCTLHQENEMVRAYGMHGTQEKSLQGFDLKHWKEDTFWRSGPRWDNIKTDLTATVGLCGLDSYVSGRGPVLVFVNTVMNLRVAWKALNFLNNWAKIPSQQLICSTELFREYVAVSFRMG
jgi:hypothetical protein